MYMLVLLTVRGVCVFVFVRGRARSRLAMPMREIHSSVQSLLIVLTQLQVCYWHRNAMTNGIVSTDKSQCIHLRHPIPDIVHRSSPF